MINLTRPQQNIRYVNPDGTLTLEGTQLIDALAQAGRELQGLTWFRTSGEVNSVILASWQGTGSITTNNTAAGADLLRAAADGTTTAGALTGTWRCLGFASDATAERRVTAFIRIA